MNNSYDTMQQMQEIATQGEEDKDKLLFNESRKNSIQSDIDDGGDAVFTRLE